MFYVDGYWCESIVRSPKAEAEWLLGFHRAHSLEAAVRWLRGQAHGSPAPSIPFRVATVRFRLPRCTRQTSSCHTPGMYYVKA